MALARHAVEIELGRSDDLVAEDRGEDDLAPRRVRRSDPVAPVGARLVEREGQHEADARAFAHAGLKDLGEAVETAAKQGGIERNDRGSGTGHRARQSRFAGRRPASPPSAAVT